MTAIALDREGVPIQVMYIYTSSCMFSLVICLLIHLTGSQKYNKTHKNKLYGDTTHLNPSPIDELGKGA